MYEAARRRPRSILYIAKTKGLLGFDFDEDKEFAPISIFLRHGIVPEACAHLVAREALRYKVNVGFVGDLDPLGMAAYLSLLAELSRWNVKVEHLGISDRWLPSCKQHLRKGFPSDIALIAIDKNETKLFRRLEEFPIRWDTVLGPASLHLLRSGMKLALEGATNPNIYTPSHHRVIRRILTREDNKFVPMP